MSDLKFYLQSSRLKKAYRVNNFTEYRIEVNFENDTDGFDITLTNPYGGLNDVFSTFDYVNLILNNNQLTKSIIDNITYTTNEDTNTISISGRDLAAILVDNDALPETLTNVNVVSYFKKRCDRYGLKFVTNVSNSLTVNELIIGSGESEISIMNNIALKFNQKIWYLYDTVYLGTWNTGAKTSANFVRGDVNVKGIKIESLTFVESSKSTKSEIRIYGSADDGSTKIVGTAKNDALVSRGIHRRSVRTSSNDDTVSKASASALREVRDTLRNNITLTIVSYTNNHFIMPNTTIRVVDDITGIDDKFFVRSVVYTKSLTDGSVMTLTTIPQDETFDVIWKKLSSGSSTTKKKTVKAKNYIDNRVKY